MRSEIIAPGVVRIMATERELRAMEDDGLGLWWTPGADEPYWAARPSFSYDVAVAGPRDFLAAEGYDAWSDLQPDDEGELLALVVTRPRGSLLTTDQVAEALGISERAVRKWAPQWPGAQKLGRDWLIPADQLGWWHEQSHRPGPRGGKTVVHTYRVQHGSSSTLRTLDQSAYYVVCEDWEGSNLLNTRLISRHATEPEAQVEVERLEREERSRRRGRAPETVPAQFDPADLPDWARRHRPVVALCERDLAFRADVCRAETDHYRAHLVRQARKRLEAEENR